MTGYFTSCYSKNAIRHSSGLKVVGFLNVNLYLGLTVHTRKVRLGKEPCQGRNGIPQITHIHYVILDLWSSFHVDVLLAHVSVGTIVLSSNAFCISMFTVLPFIIHSPLKSFFSYLSLYNSLFAWNRGMSHVNINQRRWCRKRQW